MATRTAYDAVSGTVLTAANLDKHAGGWIGYNEVTADGSAFTSEADASGLSLTVTVNSSRKVRVTARVGFTSTTGTDIIGCFITDGTNTHLAEGYALMGLTTSATTHILVQYVTNPSSGSNTYKVRNARTGAGTAIVSASAVKPTFILVEDIGTSS